jgi:hypothetical protein
MSLWKGIAVSPFPPESQAKKTRLRKDVALFHACCGDAGYFGVPCTASVTTARVSDGASISRKV